LARGPDLTECWASGKRARSPHLDVAWRPNTKGHARMGIIVPLYQHTAVARNRLRRRLRELLRRNPTPLPSVDLVVRARREAYAAPFAVLRAELAAAATRIA
jgi:ribonuclease P protein component